MTTPLLIPAYPVLLRAGLPVVYQDDVPAVVLFECDVNGEPGAYVGGCDWNTIDDDTTNGVALEDLRLDLRDPAVRDAAVRALWRKLRPGEPEPLTAPIFDCETRPDELPSEDEDPPCWWLAHPLAPENGIAFGCLIESKDGFYRKVPALNDVDFASPDRDLLALACVLAAVLP